LCNVPVVVVVADRNDREGLLARPGVQKPGLFVPGGIIGAEEVVDHEQELLPACRDLQVGHQRRAHPALGIDIMELELLHQFKSIRIIDDEQPIPTTGGAQDLDKIRPVVTENLIRYNMSRSAPIVVASCARETTSIPL